MLIRMALTLAGIGSSVLLPLSICSAGDEISFVPNVGQWEHSAPWVAALLGAEARFDREGVTLILPAEKGGTHEIRFSIEGAAAVDPRQGPQLAGCHHYYLGADPARWRSDVPRYASIRYPGVLPGIDWVFREGHGTLEYDLNLAPGVSRQRVVMRCEGVDRLYIDERGSLVLHSASGKLEQTPPVSWQTLSDGSRVIVHTRFAIVDATRFAMEWDAPDENSPLIIDPAIVWGAYFGGSLGDVAFAVAALPGGQFVVGGDTNSSSFVSFPPMPAAAPIHISRWSPQECGSSVLVWAAYISGSGFDHLSDLVVDDSENIVAVGMTNSPNFPTMGGASSVLSGATDAFVLVLSPGGSLIYSTYLGGSQHDHAAACDEESGRISVLGVTRSQNFPVTSPTWDDTLGGVQDHFVTILDWQQQVPANQLVWSTFVGGSGVDGYLPPSLIPNVDFSVGGIIAEPGGTLVLACQTSSLNFPVLNGFQMTLSGSDDWAILILDSNQPTNPLVYGTLNGGSGSDTPYELACDADGRIWVAGLSWSPNFPEQNSTLQPGFGGQNDAALLIVDSSLPPPNQRLYSTTLGSPSFDAFLDLELLPGERVALGGFCRAGFPLISPGIAEISLPNLELQPLLMVLDPGLSGGHEEMVFSTVLSSGSSLCYVTALDLESPTSLLACGRTGGGGFPIPPDPCTIFSSPISVGDAFVLRISLEQSFERGDANGDGGVDIADAIATLDYLFSSGPLLCADSGDANDDGTVNIADPIRILDRLFSGGASFPWPMGECGADLTSDSLTCNSAPNCP